MTLKQLLSKNEREQVDFNLPLPAIAGREISAGQYSVGVQRTPDASETTLGKLANALGKVNPIIAKYGESQLATTELQIQDIQQRLSELDIEKKTELLNKKEAEINKILRDEYGANPVATYRTQMLLGAEKTPAFVGHINSQIEQFKSDLLKNGNKPSELDVARKLDEITQAYIDNDEALKSNAVMRSGFMQNAASTLSEMKATIPGQLADAHKNELLIPKFADYLVNAHEKGDSSFDPVALKQQWDTYTGALKPSDQVKVLEESLALMNYDSDPEQLETAKDFLTDLQQSGVLIGNEPLDNDKDALLRNFFTKKIEELDDMKEVVEDRYRAKLKVQAKSYGDESLQEFSQYADTQTYDEMLSSIGERRLDELDADTKLNPHNAALNAMKKDEVMSALETAVMRPKKDRAKIESELPEGSEQYMRGQIESHIVNQLRADLNNDKYEPLKLQSLIVSQPIEGDALNQTGYNIKDIGVGKKFRQIMANKVSTYDELYDRALETIVRTSAGDVITLPNGEDIEIKEGALMPQRKRIARAYAAALQGLMIEEATSEIKAIADKMQAENKTVDTFEPEEGDDDAAARAREGVKLLPKLTENEEQLRTKGFDVYNAEVAGLGGVKIQDRDAASFWKSLLGLGDDPPVNISKATEGIFDVLNTKAYNSEDTQEIIKRFTSIVDDSKVYLSRNLRKLKDERDIIVNGVFTDSGALDTRRLLNQPLVPDIEETDRKIQEATEDILRARRIIGYDAQDFIDALKVTKGDNYYTDEGATIADPKAFFLSELTGLQAGPYQPAEAPEYKSSTLIKNATDEQLKEIADGYGLDLERLKESQRKYQSYINGEKPEVKPTEDIAPKTEAETKDQLELKLTPAPETPKTPVAPPPPDVPGITELDFSKRITLQTEGSKIKKPMTDLKDTFETIGAKYKIHPAFLMAIATVETGHGSSSAFKNKKNAMGVTINDKVQTFDKVEDSIEMMAKKLSSKTGPYKGLFTIDEIAAKYAPSNASKKNDPNQTNSQWPGLVKKLMKQLGVTDADTIKVLSR